MSEIQNKETTLQNCTDNPQPSTSQAPENYTLPSAKEVNQNEDVIANNSSDIGNAKSSSDSRTSESGSIRSPKSYKFIRFGSLEPPLRRNPEELVASSSSYYGRKKVELYGSDEGPKIYNVKGNLVTRPIIAKNLSEAFNNAPIYGKPAPGEDLDTFYFNKTREFVGFDLNDEQFSNLSKYCSSEHATTGKELIMSTVLPTSAILSVFGDTKTKEYNREESNLCIAKKLRWRLANDTSNNFHRKLKYRGLRLMPVVQPDDDDIGKLEADLEPGKDMVYHVRIYRPFPYNIKDRHVSTSSRHSVLSRSVALAGRLRLRALRRRLRCANDVGARLDASLRPHAEPDTCAKDMFPSGFMFINNVFYVDTSPGCSDTTARLRAWAKARGLGDFPVKDMDTRVDELVIRLGHPEVYVHQGNCEHLFTFSEIRLLNPDDPLSSQQYPVHTAVSQNQTVYCTTCAEFGAKWIVTNCTTVPFDPAYFCDTCFKMYLYKDGKKIGDFKAYSYRGNEINVLKSTG